jgi:hypothetical protein
MRYSRALLFLIFFLGAATAMTTVFSMAIADPAQAGSRDP